MECISSASFQISWNGGCSDSFVPERGLRQGCPLSPYIFTLCIERLSNLITTQVSKDLWKPITLAKGGTNLSHIFFADDLILFAEASTDQAQVIHSVLSAFGQASGQEVSKEKSKLYFSKNVSTGCRLGISQSLGIPITSNLGRYLGVPVIHGRVTVDHYKHLIENLDMKLSGWKKDTLSRAGRVTLAVSVLNALPSYAMQTSVLPVTICDLIDQRIRSFVWGSEQGQRKLHLVNWENLCKPKELGGLGLRSARELNQAYLLKLAWGILKQPSELWVDVMLTKYFTRTQHGLIPRATKRFSSLWRGIKEVWPYLNLGLQWSIRSGKETKFWSERWLDSGLILQTVVATPDLIVPNNSVADFCKPDNSWDIEKLSASLPADAVAQVLGMDPPNPSLGQDTPTWGLEGMGKYTVRSGYALITENQSDNTAENERWKTIWNWQGPNKVRHFLWLMGHNRLLTNNERRRRHLADSDLCPICNEESETVEHCIRGCTLATEVWKELIPSHLFRDFMAAPFEEWWRTNLQNKDRGCKFGLTCWQIWLCRNERIFNNVVSTKGSIRAKVNFWHSVMIQAQIHAERGRSSTPNSKTWTDISWQPDPDPWMTMNTDGSVDQHHNATAGGAIRDASGNCLQAFAMNYGSCSITRAEIRGIVDGLEIAWQAGFRHVAVQTDSKCALQILTNSTDTDHQHAAAILKFQELTKRDWTLKMNHIYREGNALADHLANSAHSMALGLHQIDSSNSAVAYWIAYDRVRSSQPRLVLRNM
ncbi:Putative ribonuclease H protein At1g65750 [Linum perenne]